MWHLISLEWRKQRDYILFKLLVFGYMFMLPGLLMIGKKLEVSGNVPVNPQVMFFQFPTVWDWLGYTGNWLVFFVFGFMAVLLVTNEYSSKTLRQNIISGLHRNEFIWSKILFMLLISIGATLYYGLSALTIGLLHTPSGDFAQAFQNAGLMPRYFLMTIGYMSFGLLVGVLVKRTSVAVFVFLAYSMFLEPVIRWALHLRFIQNSSFNYYPLNVMEDLCPLPFSGQAQWFLKEKGFELFLSPQNAIIATSVYVLIFFALSLVKLRRTDL